MHKNLLELIQASFYETYGSFILAIEASFPKSNSYELYKNLEKISMKVQKNKNAFMVFNALRFSSQLSFKF